MSTAAAAATATTTKFIRRCFRTRSVSWSPPSSSPTSVSSPPITMAGVIATVSRQKLDRIRWRSLTTITHARTSTGLPGHDSRGMPLGDDDGLLSGYRFFSSRRYDNKNKQKNKRFNLRALPFSISPEEALESFKKWAEDDQGLRYLMNYNSIRIGAAYVPVWSFDLNVRFRQQTKSKGRGSPSLYSWKPHIFEGYDQSGHQDVIHLPGGLSAYAGYSYRRSLINPVHSTTLIFMGNQTEPFGGWMLKDMKLKETGLSINVIPDAWNSTQARAFSVVKDELQGIVDGDWTNSDWNDGETPPPLVQTQVVSARRVFMPTFVIDYKILGLEYQAFVSGCDTSAPVGGVSHQIFEGSDMPIGGLSPEFQRSSRNLLVQLSSGASRLLRTFNLPILVSLFRPLFSILWFVLVRILSFTPVIGVAGGLFTGFRKVLQPWMDNRKASADWERQRQHEAEMAEDEDNETNKSSKMNDFDDVTGRARSHFQRNKDSILRSLSGDVTHEEGDFDWYSDWQVWARQQWEQQARQQQQQHEHQNYNQQQQQYQQQWQQQQQQNQRSNSKKKKDDEFKWPFDPHDPYSVLGIDRYASDSDVSNAFRKEMLKYHPDTQPNVTDAQKRRSVERSKLITGAYRKIKTERKEKRQR